MIVRMKPVSVIEARLGIEPNGRVQKFFTNTCYNHMDKYVPFKEGNLASNIVLQEDSITYKSPYAHYMYEGKVMGSNIPIKNEDGIITGYFSPKDKRKHYTGADIHYSSFHHPLASSHWDRKMVSAEMPDVVKEVQDHVNHGGK